MNILMKIALKIVEETVLPKMKKKFENMIEQKTFWFAIVHDVLTFISEKYGIKLDRDTIDNIANEIAKRIWKYVKEMDKAEKDPAVEKFVQNLLEDVKIYWI